MKNTRNAICVQKVLIKVYGGSMSGMNMNLIHKFYQLLKYEETKKNVLRVTSRRATAESLSGDLGPTQGPLRGPERG